MSAAGLTTAGLIGSGLSALALGAAFALYLIGWRRAHRRHPALFRPARLAAFLLALILLALALVWPLPLWSEYFLAWRSTQKVLVAMLAPVLIWLACPWQVTLYTLPRPTRHRIVAAQAGPGLPLAAARLITLPIVTWLLFVSLFAAWHDPGLAGWSLDVGWAHSALPWALLVAGLLFWFNILATAPHWRVAFPAWLLVVYLVTMEALNLTTGITLAFTSTPIYPHYQAIRAAHPAVFDAIGIPLLQDQRLGGIIVWVFGSLFYISAIIAVFYSLFAREDADTPQAAPNWDSDENLIAPGLEHRVLENRLTGAGPSRP